MAEQHAHQSHRHHHHPRHHTEWFRFISNALPADTFHVVRFTGTEGLNRLFSFRLDLVSGKPDVDPGKLLATRARFVILRENAPPAVFHGYPSKVEQGGHFGDYTSYTVELQPAFKRLTGLKHSAVFLRKTAEDTARELLRSLPFFKLEHEFRLTRKYPEQEFAMQYDESLFDYILFRMEEQGAYFYFAPEADRLVFADGPVSHDRAILDLAYSPPSGLDHNLREEILHAFTLTQTPLPRQVVLRCYDWKDPKRVIVGRAEVDPDGVGDVYLAGENAESEEEAKRLAQIRAEERLCKSRLFTGMSSSPLLRPGVVFNLTNHYNPTFNRAYLVTDITHEGAQEAYISLGLGLPLGEDRNHLFYRNTFTCIPSDVPFRPARTAPRAKIAGVLRAFVDGAQNKRPEMDEYGRYKLIFPFDLSGRGGGNASCWIRMAGPQTGKDSGMAFPLLPGTEVVVSFIDGDPDRPVITGSVANGETGAIAGRGNVDFSGIRSPGGAQVTFSNEEQNQRISAITPSGASVQIKDGVVSNFALHAAVGTTSAAVGLSEAASLMKNVGTGYQITHCAGADAQDVIKASFEALTGGLTEAADTLSAKASRAGVAGLAGLAGDVTKLQNDIVSWLMKTVRKVTANTPPYGVSLSAGKDAATSNLQVKPDAKQIATMSISAILSGAQALSSFASGALELTSDIADEGAQHRQDKALFDELHEQDRVLTRFIKYTESEEKARKKIEELEKKTNRDEEEDILLADLKRWIALSPEEREETRKKAEADLRYLHAKEFQNGKVWTNEHWQDTKFDVGYWLNTTHKAARNMVLTPIEQVVSAVLPLILVIVKATMQKLGGVSICSADNNVNIRAKKPVSLHSEDGILLDTSKTVNQAEDWGIVRTSRQRLGDLWKYTGGDVDDPTNLTAQREYVVVNTTTFGLFTKDHAERTMGTWVSEAPTHILKSCTQKEAGRDRSIFVEMEDGVENDFVLPQSAVPNAQIGIKDEDHGLIEAKVSEEGKITLQRGDATDGQQLSLEGECVLQNGGDVKLTLTGTMATLTAEGGTLSVEKDGSVLTGKDSSIFCDSDGITLDPQGGTVTLGQLSFKKGGEVHAGGVLKIDGDTVKIG